MVPGSMIHAPGLVLTRVPLGASSQRFGKTNSKPYLGARAIIFCISLYETSVGGGNVTDGAGTLHSLKNSSTPAGVFITSIRTCSESIVNECTTSRGAKTIVPGVALIV